MLAAASTATTLTAPKTGAKAQAMGAGTEAVTVVEGVTNRSLR